MTAYEQRSFPGAAAVTTLAADLTATGLTINLATGTGAGYPTGDDGPFVISLDAGQSGEEKVHCISTVGDTITADQRGYDSTTAVAHSAGAAVKAVLDATTIREANAAAHYTVGQITAKGQMLAGTGNQQMAAVPVGADGTVLTADSSKSAGVAFKAAVVPPLGPLALVTFTQDADGLFASTTSTVGAAFDNLPFTFTAPASGQVLVRHTSVMQSSTTAAGYLMLFTGGVKQAATVTMMLNGQTAYRRKTATFVLAGLTPGDEYTYNIGGAGTNGNTFEVDAGPILGPIIIEVWAA